MKVTINQEQDKTPSLSRKKRRQLERKLIKAKRNAWHHGEKIPMSIDTFSHTIENQEDLKKKKKKKKKKNKSKDETSELTFDEKIAKEHHRKILLEDNEAEDAHIKKLEKLLRIKSNRKTYLRGFIDDGLDYLLDFCDKDRRKQILIAEGDGEGNAWYDEQDEDQQWLANKQKQQVDLANQLEHQENNNKQEKTKKKKTSLVKFNDQVQTNMIDDDSFDEENEFNDDDDDEEEDFEEDEEEDFKEDEEDFKEDEEDFKEDEEDFKEDEEEDVEEDEEEDNDDKEESPPIKEDIYGRTIDAKGNIVKNNSSK
ncbi:unnamed protein product [Rotaria sp. Silwood2]|nr:unnamed protein product [Rotaria sp. Silwood2]